MAKLEFVICLATVVLFAECNRVPRNNLDNAQENLNDNKPPEIESDGVINQYQVPKAADVETKEVENNFEDQKISNSTKLIDKTIVVQESVESSSESDEASLFSSAAGLIAGVLNSGRRNLDALKYVPVVGNVVPMFDPVINGVSKIVQRSVNDANELNLLELKDLYNRTNDMVKILKKQYEKLSITEEDNSNLQTYAKSLLIHFGLQKNRYTYKLNSPSIAFSEAINELIKRRTYTAVQLTAPALKAFVVMQSILSSPVEIVDTVCSVDTPDAQCINNVLRVVDIVNTHECSKGDQMKFKIFKIALENAATVDLTIEELERHIVSKVKAKISASRRKRNSNNAADNLQVIKSAELINSGVNTDSVAVQRLRRNMAGNAPIGLNNDNLVNTDTKPLAGSNKLYVNAKPNITTNQVENNDKPNISPNHALNNIGIVKVIPDTSTNNLQNQKSESRRMNNNIIPATGKLENKKSETRRIINNINLGTNQAPINPEIKATDNIVNHNLGSRRMNIIGVSEQTIAARRAGNNIQANTNLGFANVTSNLNQEQVLLPNPAAPSRRSNTEGLTHSDIFDLVIAELKALYNNGQLDTRCKIFDAIADAQKEHTLCNVLLLDNVLDFTI